VEIQFNQIFTGNNSIQLAASRDSGSQLVYRIQYVLVVIDKTQRDNYKIIQYVKPIVASDAGLLTAPTSFNINLTFSNSASGGFDGNCLVGIHILAVAGDLTGFYSRSVMFDIHTQPFSSVENTIYDPSPATPEPFYCEWFVVCLMACPSGTLFNSSRQCEDCLPNC
jgi:hypothetical protein